MGKKSDAFAKAAGVWGTDAKTLQKMAAALATQEAAEMLRAIDVDLIVEENGSVKEIDVGTLENIIRALGSKKIKAVRLTFARRLFVDPSLASVALSIMKYREWLPKGDNKFGGSAIT